MEEEDDMSNDNMDVELPAQVMAAPHRHHEDKDVGGQGDGEEQKKSDLPEVQIPYFSEGGDFTTRATRRINAERIPDLAKINETG